MFLRNNFSQWYKTAIFVIMAILMIVFIGKVIDIALMFFAAFIVAASVLPLINKLSKYMCRAMAVFIVLSAVLTGILLIFIPLAMLTIDQVSSFVSDLPKHVNALEEYLNFYIDGFNLQDEIQKIGMDTFGENLTSTAGDILSKGLAAGKVVAGSITTFLILAIIVFYLCTDEERLTRSYLSFFPPKI